MTELRDRLVLGPNSIDVTPEQSGVFCFTGAEGFKQRRQTMKSYEPQVIADSTGKFFGNACRFATKEEAELYVNDLMWRWTLVRETRVVESEDPVNYRWVKGQGSEAIE